MLTSVESSYFTFLRKENRDLKKENKNLKEDFNRLWREYTWLSHVNNKLREDKRINKIKKEMSLFSYLNISKDIYNRNERKE